MSCDYDGWDYVDLSAMCPPKKQSWIKRIMSDLRRYWLDHSLLPPPYEDYSEPYTYTYYYTVTVMPGDESEPDDDEQSANLQDAQRRGRAISMKGPD